MDPATKAELDRRILEQLLTLEPYVSARVVSVYLSGPDEVATDGVIRDAWTRGALVCAPVAREAPRRMEMRTVARLEGLSVGRFGLREPGEDSPLVDAEDVRAVIVPGLAFTRRGDRLGYGGGYYDRFLEREAEKAVLIALAYDGQVVDELPTEAWDVRMDWIVTPTGAYSCRATPGRSG